MPNSPDADDKSLSLNAKWSIDELCDAFEAQLRNGGEPVIEDMLRDCPEPRRVALFRELVKLEREYRKTPDAELRRRLPEHGAVLDGLLAEAPVKPPASSDLTTPCHETNADPNSTYPEIPGYEILSTLGAGAMGVVYLARDINLDRHVALKMMLAGQFATPDERQRFRFEAEAMKTLDHPNIVPIYHVGEAKGHTFLCLKYVEQGSLADHRKNHSYTPKEAAALMAQVAQAVQHAHDRGVLHRDLKPGNILLDAAGRPYVSDFGLARRLAAEHSLTPSGTLIGTLTYMAPEQARGGKGVTVQVDVFALGAILYELLTGDPPFKGEGFEETLLLLLDDSPARRPRLLDRKIPLDLEAICLKCLEKDPTDRYPSAQALAQDLHHFLNDEPVSAQPPGMGDWLVQALRTRPVPSPKYTWPGPFWCAGLTIAQHGAVFVLVQMNQPLWAVWAVMLVGWFAVGLALWFLLLRRFRVVPVTERHTSIIALGNLMSQIVLLIAVSPWNPTASSRLVLPMYPPLTIVAGLCFFILGSTNWGRFLPIGLAVMALSVVMTAWPEAGPLLYATVVPFWLIWWGTSKWWYFVRRAEDVGQLKR